MVNYKQAAHFPTGSTATTMTFSNSPLRVTLLGNDAAIHRRAAFYCSVTITFSPYQFKKGDRSDSVFISIAKASI